MGSPDRIPVFLLSGFLGCGKSTLLNAFLNDPDVRDTAVIINEFGDVPVDHLLVRRGETTVSQVSTGCLCCSDTTDIKEILHGLQSAAREGLTGRFTRVIVEMSGLGDPAPLVNALAVSETGTGQHTASAGEPPFYLAGVVTLFDTIEGARSVENHFEALKQIAFADRIVLTKTDIQQSPEEPRDISLLSEDLRELNASADIVDRQAVDFSSLFAPRPYTAVDRGEDVAGWLALETALALEGRHNGRPAGGGGPLRHGAGIRTFSIVHDTPLSVERFNRFLDLLQKSAGQRLLRVKGIVASQERPEEPLIVHAVQHSVSDPVQLSAWPDDDRRTRLVFITNDVDPEPVRALFAAVIDAAPFSLKGSLRIAGEALAGSIFRIFSNLTRLSRRSQ